MPKTFTIEEIRKYILSKDSMGDIAYFLSEENIIKANQTEEDKICTNDICCCTTDEERNECGYFDFAKQEE